MRFQNHSKPGIHPSLLFSPSNNIPIPPIICQRKENLKKIKDYKVIEQIMLDPSKKVKIEVNKIMNPAFLLGTAFNIAYWHRKYHSGTICKGVSNPQSSKALSVCEKEEIPK